MDNRKFSEEDKKYLDLDTALARVRGNTALYSKLLNIFLKSTEFDALSVALEERNYERGAELAHSIKGMTGNLALSALFDSSTKLMGELRQGTYAPETKEQLFASYEATKLVIEKFLDQTST